MQVAQAAAPNSVWDWVRLVASVVGGFMIGALGGWDTMLEVLVIMVVLDWITGMMEAYQKKELNSSVGAKGIFKKAGYFIAVVAAVELDKILAQAAGTSSGLLAQALAAIAQALPARSIMILFLIGTEGLSLFEHLAALGVPIPRYITDALQKIKQQGDPSPEDAIGGRG